MAYEIPGFSYTLVSAADFSVTGQFRAVNVDATGKAALPAAGGRIAGILNNKPKAGESATIVQSGISACEAGAAVTIGSTVEVDATGRVVPRAAGVAVGIALETASAAGVKIAVLLSGQLV